MRTAKEALREIRNRLVYLYGKIDGTFDPPALKEVCEIADEGLADKDTSVGNAAAMREAFKKLDKELQFCEKNVNLGLGFSWEGLREHCQIVREILNDALSEPPRIVDAYTDWHDALKAAIAKCESWKPTACLECPWFVPHTTGACLMRRLYSEVKNESEVKGEQK